MGVNHVPAEIRFAGEHLGTVGTGGLPGVTLHVVTQRGSVLKTLPTHSAGVAFRRLTLVVPVST